MLRAFGSLYRSKWAHDRLVIGLHEVFLLASELWIEGGAWYKVRGLGIFKKDEAPLFIGRRPGRESGTSDLPTHHLLWP